MGFAFKTDPQLRPCFFSSKVGIIGWTLHV